MTKTAGLRLMTLADVPKVHDLLREYLKDFHLLPILNKEDIQHWFLPRDGIIDTYVVEVSLHTTHIGVMGNFELENILNLFHVHFFILFNLRSKLFVLVHESGTV